jgi:branched-chain amino acid transport system substrate-binding protein
LGAASQEAVEIAAAEINAAGGIHGRPLQVIFEDGKCAASAAASAGAKLINADKVTAIIGGLCSGETGAFVKNAMDAKIPTIAYCSSAPTLTGSGSYFFRNYPSDTYVGKFIAEYLYGQGVRKVAVLYHVSDYGTGIKDAFVTNFTALGGTVPVADGTQQTDRDYRTILAKIKSANPEYILMPLYTEGGIVAVRQAKDLGITAKLMTADTGSDSKFYQGIPETTELMYVIAKSDLTESFKAKFTVGSTTQEVPICAPQAYDAAYILADALKAVDTDPDMIAEYIRKGSFEGVSGKMTFDTNGDLLGSQYSVWKVKKGKTELVQ